MAKFNYKEISTSIANSPIGVKRVQTVMDNKFTDNKTILLQEFDAHPITKEIEEGGENISNTLGGKGNLRGFIGFPENEDPITPVRQVLENELVMTKKGVTVDSKGIKFKFSLRIPQESLRNAAPMPWESGLSWLAGLETGRISGLGNFLAGLFKSPEPSRSGQGVQAKNPVSGIEFKRTPYLSELFNKFIARFK